MCIDGWIGTVPYYFTWSSACLPPTASCQCRCGCDVVLLPAVSPRWAASDMIVTCDVLWRIVNITTQDFRDVFISCQQAPTFTSGFILQFLSHSYKKNIILKIDATLKFSAIVLPFISQLVGSSIVKVWCFLCLVPGNTRNNSHPRHTLDSRAANEPSRSFTVPGEGPYFGLCIFANQITCK